MSHERRQAAEGTEAMHAVHANEAELSITGHALELLGRQGIMQPWNPRPPSKMLVAT